jgi:hypothetical protein
VLFLVKADRRGQIISEKKGVRSSYVIYQVNYFIEGDLASPYGARGAGTWEDRNDVFRKNEERQIRRKIE